jgi:hypothetical protein
MASIHSTYRLIHLVSLFPGSSAHCEEPMHAASVYLPSFWLAHRSHSSFRDVHTFAVFYCEHRTIRTRVRCLSRSAKDYIFQSSVNHPLFLLIHGTRDVKHLATYCFCSSMVLNSVQALFIRKKLIILLFFASLWFPRMIYTILSNASLIQCIRLMSEHIPSHRIPPSLPTMHLSRHPQL